MALAKQGVAEVTRRRSRSRSRSGLPLVVVVTLVLLCGVTALPAASFSIAGIDRGTAAGVTDDPNAILGLTVSQSVTLGTTDDLVVVTNDLGSDATLTVTLRSDSTGKGDLSVNGVTGDEVSFDLAAGSSQRVDVVVSADPAYADTQLYFHVSADSSSVDGTVTDRQTTIVA